MSSMVLQIVVGCTLGLSLVGVVMAIVYRIRTNKMLGELQHKLAEQSQQFELLHDSMLGMGRQLLEQEKKIASLDVSASFASDSKVDPDQLQRWFDEGKPVDEIVSESGLDKAEVELLATIRNAQRAEA